MRRGGSPTVIGVVVLVLLLFTASAAWRSAWTARQATPPGVVRPLSCLRAAPLCQRCAPLDGCGAAAADGTRAAPLRVACLGDSITEWYRRDNASWPDLLQRTFDDRAAAADAPGGSGPCEGGGVGSTLRADVRNFGRSGSGFGFDFKGDANPGLTVAEYRHSPEFAAARAFRPDIAIVMLGTNDGFGRAWRGDAYLHDRIIETLMEVASWRRVDAGAGHVSPYPSLVVALPPPVVTAPAFDGRPWWGHNNTAAAFRMLRRSVAQLNASVRVVAAVADVHRAFRERINVLLTRTIDGVRHADGELPEFRGYLGPETLLVEGVHPNAAGTRLVHDAILAALCGAPMPRHGPGADRLAYG